MSINISIANISIVHDLGLSVAEAANILKPGTHVYLMNDYSQDVPESIGITTENGTRIGCLPSDLSFEIREITSDFNELNAEIIKLEKCPSLSFAVEILLSDFSWDQTSGIPVLILTTNNAGITPAKGATAYNIFHMQLDFNKRKAETDCLTKEYNRSRRW